MCVQYEEDKNRAAAYDGERVVGECDYERTGKTWLINRVHVEDAYVSGGAADQLVECVARHARLKGAIVVPYCLYAMSWFRRHRSYKDVL